jgi:hypothetical protein
MYKVVGLLKRRAGLSTEAFRQYYESHHRIIGEKYLRDYAVRYMRRYLEGFSDPITGQVAEQEFDVLLEIWYRDKQAFEAANIRFVEPRVSAEIAADEERLFDRSASRFFTLEEVESDMTGEH